ncbi:TMV resistance protein N-like [Daucus carota subsp. sativus]|uniref:TMV resistance protein N-like n=1 Tax=Daucus carota subsp. sativus TaxID=79200 RepID=UPI003083DC5A
MASASSSTPSSCASYLNPTGYHAFLSFRGEDTQFNFTSHLYHALVRHGIRTFKDDPELLSGEAITDALVSAIHQSKTYIVVLSENYASSRWCLDELINILNCCKTEQRLIIPVFYNIEPSVVRHQTGSYHEAFQKHEIRFVGEMEKIHKWRLALTEVAEFSGKHVSAKRCEAHIVNEIVEEILRKINLKALEVAKYPVGLNSRVECLMTLLSSDTEGVYRIGIYGMGGVGKTTLAKALYNQLLLRGFQGSCFLANIREVSKTVKGIVSLQQQLINDILKSKTRVKIHNVEEGTKSIREIICSAKILVLIDDIDELEQYESLVGPFASGSIVIITTRDEEILDKIEVESRYRVNELDDAESLALFTQHAFEKAKPDNTFMVLSKDILRLAGGLPLALKVFGSYLSMRSEVGWKSYIEKLQRHPNSTIQHKLLISLDALESDDPMLKKMFLDIACFFIGRKKIEVVEILKTYYSYVEHNIDILDKRCLLTTNDRDELRMHDLLRDMGREVARNNSADEPGKHSRLWASKDICIVLKKHKGTEAIEAIIPSDFYYQTALNGVSFNTETFKRMSNLRFLCLNYLSLIGSYEQIFEDLRWLCWEFCPLKCLPSEFYPQNLVVLKLPHSKLRIAWEVTMASQIFEKLMTLDLSDSLELTTTPDFTKFPCLETLNLEGCKSLEEVHISIGSLVKLVSLNLGGCVNLRCLPDTICNLTALKRLDIVSCRRLQALPAELGNIKSLEELNAEELTVSKLPDSIGCLSKLVVLELSYNKNLENIPDSICNLRALEVLCISGCSSVEALPLKLGNIESLRKLDAEGLSVLKLPDSIGCLGKLVELRLSSNNYLETLPGNVCNLRALEVLSISDCRSLKALPVQCGNIQSLKVLNATELTVSKLPDSIGCLFKLVQLRLNNNENLESLPDSVCNMRSLQNLEIEDCCRLLYIVKLPPNLKWIRANGCTSMKRLHVYSLKQLETLNLRNCSALAEILGLEELASLEVLHLTGCSSLTEIQGLKQLTSIRILDLGGCNSSLACTSSKCFFEIYSGFGHEIKIYTSAEFPDWINESLDLSESANSESTLSLNLVPDVSHNFLAMILCFTHLGGYINYVSTYSVKNIRSDFVWTGSFYINNGPLMIIVPRSDFPVTEGDDKIELTAPRVKIHGIHLLYKTEEATTTDEYSSSTVNVGNKRSYDFVQHIDEYDSITASNVEDGRSYPCKWLKYLESDKNWLSL